MTKHVSKTLMIHLRNALKERKLSEAADILFRLKKEDPLSLESRGLELEYYIESDRFREANELAPHLLQLFPASGRVHFLTGKLAYKLKHYADAESHFRESNRIYPHLLTQHFLGKTLTQMGSFEEAEPLLLKSSETYPPALLDLAWLYERMGDHSSALRSIESYMKTYPDNQYAAQQRSHLKALMMAPETLIEEAQSLKEFGEQVPDAILPEYIQRLFESGQTPRAREEVNTRFGALNPRIRARIAWVCYKASALDLACDLFLSSLKENLSNVKYLAALESAASRCNRLQEVVAAYENLVSIDKKLYGRIRSLKRKL